MGEKRFTFRELVDFYESLPDDIENGSEECALFENTYYLNKECMFSQGIAVFLDALRNHFEINTLCCDDFEDEIKYLKSKERMYINSKGDYVAYIRWTPDGEDEDDNEDDA